MRISLGDGWGMKTNKDCIVVYKRRFNKKKEKFEWDARYYYPTLEKALDGLVHRSIQDMRLENLRTICLEIRKMKETILRQIPEEMK